MFEFTKKSVDHTIFVTNLIKKTKFMSSNSKKKNFGFKSTSINHLLFEDHKLLSKDDNSMAYGEKDMFQDNRMKRKWKRNLSHRGYLNELEENLESTQKIKDFIMISPIGNNKPIIEENEESEEEEESTDKPKRVYSPDSNHNKEKDDFYNNSPILLKKNSSAYSKISFLKGKNMVKKVISMPNLNGFFEEECNGNGNCNGNGVCKKEPQQYDEIFFYYFESFLDQFLLKKLNRKRLVSQG